MTTIDLFTLGRLAVFAEGEEVPAISIQPVRAGFLVYLALEGEVTRDAALGCLWPDQPLDRARHALSQTLYQLRQDLGGDWLDISGSYLRRTEDLVVDAVQFAEAVGERAYETALELYRGPFLRSCHLVSSASFQHWVDRQAARLATLHRAARVGEIDRLLAIGDQGRALEVAHGWVGLSPLEDEPRQHLIQLLVSAGARGEALRQYHEFASLMDSEGLEPLPETRAMLEQIRRSEAVMRAPPVVGLESPPGSEELAVAVSQPRAFPSHLIVVLALLAATMIGFLLGPERRTTRTAEQFPDINSVAILPLENRSGDPDDAFFVDGIHEALIENLASREMRVISRASVMQYRNGGIPVREIARALDVDAVIEGSVARAGDSVRVEARLLHAASGEPVASIGITRRSEDVLELMREISAGLLGARGLTPTAEVVHPDPLPPVDPEAYEAYLRAQHLLHGLDVGGSIGVYDSAIAIDPTFARPHAGLAQAYFIGGFFDVVPRALAWPKARTGALQALERDSTLASAHTVLGYIALYDDWDWSRAETELVTALELDRNDVLARHGYADLLMLRGFADEGLHQVELARAVDPLSPLMNGAYVGHLYAAREFERVLEEVPRVRGLLEDPSFAGEFLASTLWELGRFDEAFAEFRTSWVAEPELVSAVDRALANHGPHSAMRAAADYAAARWEPGKGAAHVIALRYALAEAHDEAFLWLERAYEERRPQFLHLMAYPAFDDLRTDPRHDRLIERIRLH